MSTDSLRYRLKTDPHSSHDRILKLLKNAPSSSRILDLGVAGGYIGESLSKRNLQIIGIEKDKESAQKAAPYYNQIFALDLDKDEIPMMEPFDYIIMADILEHLYDPMALLVNMRAFLKEGGRLIISLPNVANLIVRFSLFLGIFNYREKGILDKSHIRFFTLRTAEGLIKKAGFKTFDFYPTSLPFRLILRPVWLADIFNRVYYLFAKLRPRVFAYQFVFTVCK